MSATRLKFIFLSPHILRPVRAAEPVVRVRAAPRRAFRSGVAKPMKRHGTAVEPVPLVDADSGLPVKTNQEPETKPDKPTPLTTTKTTTTKKEKEKGKGEKAKETDKEKKAEPKKPEPKEDTSSKPPPPPPEKDQKEEPEQAGPMEEVMKMQPPPPPPPESGSESGTTAEDSSTSSPTSPLDTQQQPTGKKPPPVRYVHHFDSYVLVNRLAESGFTREQGITIMEALRGMLSDKVEGMQDKLVSRSDVDNETYLFKAACSELSTEVKNNRRASDEVMREQRMRLQHEVDILGQSLNQEILTLNDTVRGLLNDHKMVVREEQKAIDNSIQQTNYKISSTLGSDLRSEIEGLRWILIRRAAIGIAFMTVIVLAALRYSSYAKQQRREAEERERAAAEDRRRRDGKTDHSASPDAAEILAAS